MVPGDIVSWVNGSYIIATGASGAVVDVHDTFVVVKRLDMEAHPHISPYTIRRVWELVVVAKEAEPEPDNDPQPIEPEDEIVEAA